jgi:lipoprotein-releasing system ATP-binding protein
MNASAGSIEVEDLLKEYPSPAGPIRVLDGISFRLEPGQSLAVIGPSGSGKSTLLSILGALEPPTSGLVRLAGVDPHSLSEADAAAFRSRSVGFVFQDHHLLPQLTLFENVLVPVLPRSDRSSPAHVERARRLIDRVSLGHRSGHFPAALSGGERQRAALARALVGKPALVLADEPTGNLDRKSAGEVGDLLLELQKEEGIILVLATHSAELASRFSRRAELVGGKLVERLQTTDLRLQDEGPPVVGRPS